MKSFWQDAGKLAADIQTVIALRSARLAAGDKRRNAELRRMFSEKMAAFFGAQGAMGIAIMGGPKPKMIPVKAQSPCRRRVNAYPRRG